MATFADALKGIASRVPEAEVPLLLAAADLVVLPEFCNHLSVYELDPIHRFGKGQELILAHQRGSRLHTRDYTAGAEREIEENPRLRWPQAGALPPAGASTPATTCCFSAWDAALEGCPVV